MHTVETKLYSFEELSEEAQETVLKREANRVYSDPEDFTLSECIDSLKAIVAHLGGKLTDWQIGPYNRNNFAKTDFPSLDYRPSHIQAFVLRRLIDAGYTRPKHFHEMTFPGICPFTGMCFDDDLAETIWETLLEGNSLQSAIDRCADKIKDITEQDIEYRASKEGILECLDTKAEIYTESGKEF